MYDLTGNGNHATLYNGVGFNTANGGVLEFDGTNDIVDNITQGINIQINTPFTANVIFRTTSLSAAQLIVNCNVFVNGGWRLDIGSGVFRILMLNFDGGSGYALNSPQSTYSIGSIYDVNAVFNGNSSATGLSLYVNGKLIQSTITVNSNPGSLTNSKITLGASQVNTTQYGNFLNGNIYKASLYNRALTQSEVQQNFNALRGRYNL